MNADELIFFIVHEDGVIMDPDVSPPTLRAHVYERIDPHGARTPQELIDEIERCPPLTGYFQALGQQYLEETELTEPNETSLHSAQFSTQQLILCALGSDPDNGWKLWIELSGLKEMVTFKTHINEWLQSDIDWSEREFFDPIWDGQTAALGYFCDLPTQTLCALGIKIADGEHPNSTYHAALLVSSINDANREALRLSLDFRFLPSGASSDRAQYEFGVAVPLRSPLGTYLKSNRGGTHHG